MKLANRLVTLAHSNLEIRRYLVPILREAVLSTNLRMYPVGTEMVFRWALHKQIKQDELIRVVGYKPDIYTDFGPDPFITFYVIEKVSEPGTTYTVHPRTLHTYQEWKSRPPYDFAFNVLSRAMKKSGLLNDYKRFAVVRGELGYHALHGGLPSSEVKSYLLRVDSFKGGEIKEQGNQLVVSIPVGQHEHKDFRVDLISEDIVSQIRLRRL